MHNGYSGHAIVQLMQFAEKQMIEEVFGFHLSHWLTLFDHNSAMTARLLAHDAKSTQKLLTSLLSEHYAQLPNAKNRFIRH